MPCSVSLFVFTHFFFFWIGGVLLSHNFLTNNCPVITIAVFSRLYLTCSDWDHPNRCTYIILCCCTGFTTYSLANFARNTFRAAVRNCPYSRNENISYNWKSANTPLDSKWSRLPLCSLYWPLLLIRHLRLRRSRCHPAFFWNCHRFKLFSSFWNLRCCCWLPDLFRGMGAWRKTMEPQKPGNSPGSGPEVIERQRVAKEWAAQRVRSWTVQNEMRSVLGRVSTGAARRILDSTNPREIET